jgi:capsular polysaccharide transport system permease protein
VSLPVAISRLQNRSGLVGWLAGLGLTRLAFLAIVGLPTAFAVIFYGVLANPRYVSESQFIVRSVKAPKVSGLDAIFRTFGMSASDDDASAVQGYLESRDAVRDLEAKLPLRQLWSSQHGDLFSRFPRPFRNDTFEALYEYYLGRITVSKSTHTGITTLRVVAFRPEDAHLITSTLLRLAEDLVNRMNQRAQNDAMKSAQAHLERAQKAVLESQEKLNQFRNRELMVDPSSESLKQIELVGTLRVDLAQTTAQLDQSRVTAPSGPGLQALMARQDALRDRIVAEQAKIAGNRDAMANKISEFEGLALERKFTETQLMSASQSLESAIQDARRQQIYLEQVVKANVPDESTEPRRLRMIITVLVFSFTLFAMVWILYIGAREHANG